MTETIIVAVLSLIGTLVGSLGGILAANKLVVYRIEQLEKKVERHNNVIERVYKLEKDEATIKEKIEKHDSVIERVHQLEKDEAVIKEEIKVANHRIDDLEHN